MRKEISRASRKSASRTTSKAVAGKAARALASEESTADEKSVAASALAQVGDETTVEAQTTAAMKYVEALEATNAELGQRLREEAEIRNELETANASLQAEVGRLQSEYEKSEVLCRKLEQDFADMTHKDSLHYTTEERLRRERDEARAEVERLTVIAVGTVAPLQLEVEQLKARQPRADVALLMKEVDELKGQVRWYKENAKVQR